MNFNTNLNYYFYGSIFNALKKSLTDAENTLASSKFDPRESSNSYRAASLAIGIHNKQVNEEFRININLDSSRFIIKDIAETNNIKFLFVYINDQEQSPIATTDVVTIKGIKYIVVIRNRMGEWDDEIVFKTFIDLVSFVEVQSNRATHALIGNCCTCDTLICDYAPYVMIIELYSQLPIQTKNTKILEEVIESRMPALFKNRLTSIKDFVKEVYESGFDVFDMLDNGLILTCDCLKLTEKFSGVTVLKQDKKKRSQAEAQKEAQAKAGEFSEIDRNKTVKEIKEDKE